MANKVASCERLKPYLTRFEGFVDTFQFLLSLLAVTLVVANEFVTHNFTVPYIGISWEEMQVWVRGFTWFVFVFDFLLYGLASAKPLRYARRHLLELVICFTWVPYYDASLLKHVSSLLSLDGLTAIGSLVHTWMVGRWTMRRFRAHPHVVIASVGLVTIASASLALMKAEPQTFTNLSDAVWFCIQTVFTVGYGEIVPKTELGRLIAGTLIVFGVAIGWVYIALLTKLFSAKFFPDQTDPVVKLAAQVEEQNRLIAKLVEQNAATMAQN